jgi:hypothetical protein
LILGATHYRLHQYPEALAVLTRGGGLPPFFEEDSETGVTRMEIKLFLAMTQYQLGQKDQARNTLRQFQQRCQDEIKELQQNAAGPGDVPETDSFFDPLRLFREAETLLKEPKS